MFEEELFAALLAISELRGKLFPESLAIDHQGIGQLFIQIKLGSVCVQPLVLLAIVEETALEVNTALTLIADAADLEYR